MISDVRSTGASGSRSEAGPVVEGSGTLVDGLHDDAKRSQRASLRVDHEVRAETTAPAAPVRCKLSRTGDTRRCSAALAARRQDPATRLPSRTTRGRGRPSLASLSVAVSRSRASRVGTPEWNSEMSWREASGYGGPGGPVGAGARRAFMAGSGSAGESGTATRWTRASSSGAMARRPFRAFVAAASPDRRTDSVRLAPRGAAAWSDEGKAPAGSSDVNLRHAGLLPPDRLGAQGRLRDVAFVWRAGTPPHRVGPGCGPVRTNAPAMCQPAPATRATPVATRPSGQRKHAPAIPRCG